MATRSARRSKQRALAAAATYAPATGAERAKGLGRDALARVNVLNIGLMLVSAAAACVLPFEVFLASYAILGPLHYLTQISWLHDRRYFTTGRYDWIPLVLLGAIALEAMYGSWVRWPGAPLTAFVLGVIAAFVARPVVKVAALLACLVVAAPLMRWTPALLFFGIFLTTIVHVYLFTGLFILAGSMKTRSVSGYASLAVFVACGAGLLLAQPAAAAHRPSPYVVASLEPFDGLIDATARLLPTGGRLAVGRFLAFAYTYHYLNWFSKTGVIRWHEISGTRMAGIGVLWLASVALYAWDYATGLAALFFLSVVHVFLEFPLDARTLVDVVGRRRRPAAVPR